MAKSLFVALGSFAFLIGIIGVFVPLLPTTPFLILAAFCFSKGSPRFHGWLINHAVFGPPIQDWNKRRVIKTRYKALASSMLLLSFLIVAGRETLPFFGKIFIALFFIGLSIFIWRQKSR
jgi:uncharacterized protein